MLCARAALALACASLAAGVSFSQKGTKHGVEAQRADHTDRNGLGQPVSTQPRVTYHLPRNWEVTEHEASQRGVFEDVDTAEHVEHDEEREEDTKYNDTGIWIASFGKAFEKAVGFRIDWILFKVIAGLLLILPSVPNMLMWEAHGHPPHPFLLSEEAVPGWPKWAYDIAQLMALIGLDLIFLAGIEYDWKLAMYIFRIFVYARMFQGFGVFLYGLLRKKSAYSSSFEEKIEVVKGEPVSIEAENRFQDFTTSVVHLSVLLAAQMTFMGFYSWEMTKPTPFTARAYTYWLAAIPMQVVARGLMGRTFCHECSFWHTMLHIHHDHEVKIGDGDDAEVLQLSPATIIFRGILSFYVNNISMAWIAWSLPIFTMSAPTDINFVKDCFAIVFITTLDDLADNVNMTVERAGLSRRNTA